MTRLINKNLHLPPSLTVIVDKYIFPIFLSFLFKDKHVEVNKVIFVFDIIAKGYMGCH